MISQPEDDGMGDYPSEESPPAPTEKETPDSIDEENAENASKTALVPKSMCGGCKVGEMMKMRVVADHGDEMELEPMMDSDSKNMNEMSSDEEIDAMDEKA